MASNSAFEAARLLKKMKDQGMTFAEVNDLIGGAPEPSVIEDMLDSFRSENNRAEFEAWVNA